MWKDEAISILKNRWKKEGETGTSSVSASLASFQARCRFDYAVLRARSPRQVITPGDGGTGDSSSPSPYHRVLYCLCPSCRQRVHCCQRSSRGHVIVSILIRVLYTSQAAFLSLRRGVRWCDTDRPPCPTRCPPMSPYENQAVNLFLARYKKGGQPVLSPWLSPFKITYLAALASICGWLC